MGPHWTIRTWCNVIILITNGNPHQALIYCHKANFEVSRFPMVLGSKIASQHVSHRWCFIICVPSHVTCPKKCLPSELLLSYVPCMDHFVHTPNRLWLVAKKLSHKFPKIISVLNSIALSKNNGLVFQNSHQVSFALLFQTTKDISTPLVGIQTFA